MNRNWQPCVLKTALVGSQQRGSALTKSCPHSTPVHQYYFLITHLSTRLTHLSIWPTKAPTSMQHSQWNRQHRCDERTCLWSLGWGRGEEWGWWERHNLPMMTPGVCGCAMWEVGLVCRREKHKQLFQYFVMLDKWLNSNNNFEID